MKVLAIHYSQSGQLTQLMNNITKQMEDEQISVEHIVYTPQKKYPFPWSKEVFFDVMPDCVLNRGCEITAYELKDTKYDLILLGYQPWFLSPSIPTMGLLKNSKFKAVLKDTPVVTVIGGRNMWINSQKEVQIKIEEVGGKIIGNIPFYDKSQNLLSAISIMHWMFTGNKTKKWGIVPLPGVSEEDIKESSIFGVIIADYLKGNIKELQGAILNTHKIDVKWSIVFIEARAKKLFTFWAKLIERKGKTPQKRKQWLYFYRFYLIFALFIVSPIVLTIYAIIFRPFLLNKEKEEKIKILSV